MSVDFEDEEAPPDLIDVSAIPAEEAEEPPTARVPITLVTGTIWHSKPDLDSENKAKNLYRIPWRRQNHLVELHIDRETRQENCCDYERFVNSTVLEDNLLIDPRIW